MVAPADRCQTVAAAVRRLGRATDGDGAPRFDATAVVNVLEVVHAVEGRVLDRKDILHIRKRVGDV